MGCPAQRARVCIYSEARCKVSLRLTYLFGRSVQGLDRYELSGLSTPVGDFRIEEGSFRRHRFEIQRRSTAKALAEARRRLWTEDFDSTGRSHWTEKRNAKTGLRHPRKELDGSVDEDTGGMDLLRNSSLRLYLLRWCSPRLHSSTCTLRMS